MKRLSGGAVLLNLTDISLGLTSGEVTISDAGVLGELTELRNFIDTQRDFSKGFKSLKPVLVEYRSSASKFNGIALANLSFNTDALHMSIGVNTIQADGKMLVIAINVVYAWSDYIGYQISSAKLKAYEVTASGDGTFTGDVGIAGDLEVGDDATISGDLSVTGKITGGEIIENMSGYSFINYEWDPMTIEYIYGGVVKNGNKITFALALNITKTASISSGFFPLGSFRIPTDVLAKLYPTEIGTYSSILDFKVINAIDEDNTATPIQVLVDKSTSGGAHDVIIGAKGNTLNELTTDVKNFVRIEATFLLSDNLIPQE